MQAALRQQALGTKAHNGNVSPLQHSRVAMVARPARAPVTVENRVAIRFQRLGRKKLPFYRIVATDSKSKRSAAPIEFLGWYDPLKKETNLNAPSIKKWLAVGAQPTDSVRSLLKKAFVIQPDPVKVVVPKVEV